MGDHYKKYYVVLKKGEKLSSFLPGFPVTEDYYVPSASPSWGCNKGAYIFNWDGDYAILSYSEKFANKLLAKLGDKLEKKAFVHYCYEGVFYCDTEDGAIARMADACGK